MEYAQREASIDKRADIHLLPLSDQTLALDTKPSRNGWLPKGWRFSVASGALLAFLVFLLNAITTIFISAKAPTNAENTLFDGDCDQVRQLNTMVHLLINVLSTTLLSTSNYAMQCLTAPTRKEVDAAHAARNWLDIGVLSLRNLNRISRRRAGLWAVLGLSSLPLHLLYNSAVYSSVVAFDYSVISINEAMLSNANSTDPLGIQTSSTFYSTALSMQSMAQANKLDRLENGACITAYATAFQTKRTNLLLVYDNESALPGPLSYETYEADIAPAKLAGLPDPYYWICGNKKPTFGVDFIPCSNKFKEIGPAEWAPFGKKVSHCLSAPAEQHCKLQFSSQIAWTVVVFNLVKVIVLCFVALGIRENPLLTIGDALASFLTHADETTKGFCLMGKKNIKWWKPLNGLPSAMHPRPYEGIRQRWKSAVSVRRWVICMSLYFVVLTILIGLFTFGIVGRVAPASQLMSLGFGEADPRSFINWSLPNSGSSGLVSNVLMANFPQVILSAIYYTYNGIFTSFSLAHECSYYALHRKGLRVSTDHQGAQRTTYFLQLPYRFGLPLMMVSGILHWLCSQSIFLVSVGIDRVANENLDYVSCGYSPRAMLSVIIIGFFMVLVSFVSGRKRFPSSMPVAGSCSSSISALCHLPEGESTEEAAIQRVQWGVTSSGVDFPDGTAAGHCSFSTEQVNVPEKGAFYAGVHPQMVRLPIGR